MPDPAGHDMRARDQCLSRRVTSKKGEIIWCELKSSNEMVSPLVPKAREEELKRHPMQQDTLKASNG